MVSHGSFGCVASPSWRVGVVRAFYSAVCVSACAATEVTPLGSGGGVVAGRFAANKRCDTKRMAHAVVKFVVMRECAGTGIRVDSIRVCLCVLSAVSESLDVMTRNLSAQMAAAAENERERASLIQRRAALENDLEDAQKTAADVKLVHDGTKLGGGR